MLRNAFGVQSIEVTGPLGSIQEIRFTLYGAPPVTGATVLDSVIHLRYKLPGLFR